MPQPSYAYACARISALEKGILNGQTARRLAESGLDDVMRALMDLRYGGMPDATANDCERMIENERVRTAETIRELSPAPELTDLMLLQTDVQNLKVLVKARMLGLSDAALSEGGLYAHDFLRRCVLDQHYGELPEQLCAALTHMERLLTVRPEPQIVSVSLDYGYLACCMAAAEKIDEPFAGRYFAALCDFDNVLTFLRLRAMGAVKDDLDDMHMPVGGVTVKTLKDAYELSAESLTKALSGSVAKDAMNEGLSGMLVTGNIGMLEKARDDYLLSLVNAHRHDAMTIFPVIGYFLARDREAKAIRLIVTVKKNGLDDAVILERLRELYG